MEATLVTTIEFGGHTGHIGKTRKLGARCFVLQDKRPVQLVFEPHAALEGPHGNCRERGDLPRIPKTTPDCALFCDISIPTDATLTGTSLYVFAVENAADQREAENCESVLSSYKASAWA
jgi:hypothetical protein